MNALIVALAEAGETFETELKFDGASYRFAVRSGDSFSFSALWVAEILAALEAAIEAEPEGSCFEDE